MSIVLRTAAIVFALFYTSCTFVYDTETIVDDSIPDITMENVDWTRMRGGKAQARLEAAIADRYEKTHIMELRNYTFEQYDMSSGEVDSTGSGGKARVELENGNMRMTENIVINVNSEDMSLDAENLEWRDKEKTLTSADSTPVHVGQESGTNFEGNGFSADVRSRTWHFNGGAEGDYYLEDIEEEDAGNTGEENTVKENTAEETPSNQEEETPSD
ncbi:MAG: LPS export ABC transporter periplasmic protein LptC [Spirochaetaceae bacterium]|jgi:LPS export ABC transporter protein LptC|nr:LPS export ABC transporter periplasmic protein LptC [Spirochaetaceae bacterium]